MLFWIPSKPTSELFHIPITMKKRETTVPLFKINTAVSEGFLIFSRSIGTLSEELQEKCLPTINRRPDILEKL